MDITPLVPADRQLIRKYGNGGFIISGTRWDGSVLVLPDHTRAWPVTAMAEVTLDSLGDIAEAGVDILLLGCGRVMSPAPRDLRIALRAAGIVVEPMDTGAACRTYDVLVTEGRRVAAALIAVE